MASLPETLADLFEASRSSRRAGGPRLARAERDQLEGVLKAKSRIALGDVEQEIAHAYRRALDVKLVDIFAGAWSSISAISELGDTAKFPAGERHFVPLASHRISSHHQPKVEVLIDGIPLIELALDVALQAHFDAAVLDIEGGNICAIKPGNCTATASVSCRGVPLASVSSRRLALPAEMTLKPPRPIRAVAGRASPGGEATLTLSGWDEQGERIQFRAVPRSDDADNTWLVGRRSDRVDFAIAHRLVSNEHARIRYSRARGMEICDLGSSNGTRLDGKPIGRDFVSLTKARKVAFGGFEMEVSLG